MGAIAEQQPTGHEHAKLLRFNAPGQSRRDASVPAMVSVGGATPRPPAGARSRRLVTVLFVDIVESTRWISLLGDQRWLDLQEQHESMTREAVRRFRGRYLRTTGDGFVVTFATCMAALLAARCIVESTRHAFGLDVRAALHSGECEIRGRRAGGVVFHICARIISLAQAGEILVSRAVREVAPASSVRFVDRGSHALKGLPGEWELYGAQECGDEEAGVFRPRARRHHDRSLRSAKPVAGVRHECELDSCACAG